MYNIMIVDDEPFVREQLISLIDWEKEDCLVIAEAYDGEMALEYLKGQQIHIIITDIKMPIMNGLELIRQAKTIKPNIRFIVLSAYDEFELVREAFKLGVFDYMLKSNLNSKVLSEMLNDIKKELNGSNKVNTGNEQYNNILYQEKLRRLLLSSTKIDIDGVELGFLHKHKNSFIRVALLKIDLPVGKVLNQDSEVAIQNILFRFIHPFNQEIEVCKIESNEYALIILSKKSLNESLATLFYNIEKCFKDDFNISIVMGISDEGSSEIVNELFKQAQQSCMYRFVDGNVTIYYYASIKKRSSLNSEYFKSKIFHLKNLLSNIEVEDASRYIEDLCINKIDVSIDDIEKIRELFYKYYIYIDDFSVCNNLKHEIKTYMDIFRSHLYLYGDLQELNQWITDVMSFINNMRKKYSKPVREVIRYLKENYNKDLRLTSVAEHMGISSEYLSRIFKNETGYTLVKYIEKIRIQNAIELMKDKNVKIYEISQEVGYNSEHYFSRAFKKVTGMSPKKFSQKQL